MFQKKSSHSSKYELLYERIKTQILNGHLKGKLISKRVMASQLGLSVNTVSMALEQLISEGYLISKEKVGYFVVDLQSQIAFQPQKTVVEKKINEKQFYDYDFSFTSIDSNSFPYTTWKRLLKNNFDEQNNTVLKKSNFQGEWSLRSAISTYLMQTRGVKASANEIIIGSSTASLLTIISSLFNDTHIVGIENPVYQSAYYALSKGFAHSVSIDMDLSIKIEDLEQNNVSIFYFTPSHQFPLCFSIPIAERIKLLNWANQKPDRFIIEDDYDSEFRYNSLPIPSLQSMDSSNRVLYLGTFSKSISPSLRISYMVLPKSLFKKYRLLAPKLINDVSKLEQNVVSDFINLGHFDRHLNRMRKIYRQKREIIVQQFYNLKNIEILGEESGHHILLKVANGLDEEELCKIAEDNHIKVYPISVYFTDKKVFKGYLNTILLGYGELTIEEIYLGTKKLIQVWNCFNRYYKK